MIHIAQCKTLAKDIAHNIGDDFLKVHIMVSDLDRLKRFQMLLSNTATHATDELATEFNAMLIASAAKRLMGRAFEIDQFIDNITSIEAPELEFAKSNFSKLIAEELHSRKNSITIQ